MPMVRRSAAVDACCTCRARSASGPTARTSPDFAEQCDQALVNLRAVLKAAAMGPEHVVKLTCFVVGQQPLAALYDARRRHLPNVAPASTTLIVQGLAAPDWLIEIEAIAAA